jgi:hypothetical protein
VLIAQKGVLCAKDDNAVLCELAHKQGLLAALSRLNALRRIPERECFVVLPLKIHKNSRSGTFG